MAVHHSGPDLVTTMSTSGASGGGSVTSAGPALVPSPACQIGVFGIGQSQHVDRGRGRDPRADVWSLRGWTGPEIDRLVLRTGRGGRLELPVGGLDLGIGIGFFGVAVLAPYEVHNIEGFDTTGALVDRCWLVERLRHAESLHHP